MPRNRTAKETIESQYNSRLIKGGALLENMRLLVRYWQETDDGRYDDTALAKELLNGRTASRARDILSQVFLPRFVNGNPRNAWKVVRELEDCNAPVEIIRPVYYWITARNERLLYDFVCSELFLKNEQQEKSVTTNAVVEWINSQLAAYGKTWSTPVTTRVAQGILATLRDFGILEGAVKKRIAPVYIPVESFAYIAFAIWREGRTGTKLVNHNDWRLFLFHQETVERMFLAADRHGLLRYQAAGGIVRIDFSFHSFKEMADAIVARAY